MATSSFDREFIITDEKVIEKLIEAMENPLEIKRKSFHKRNEMDIEKLKKMIGGKENRNSMQFNIGDKVKLPSYNIELGVVTGIEQYKDWDFDDSGMYDYGEVSYDYQITYVESGCIVEEWYSESWLEAFS